MRVPPQKGRGHLDRIVHQGVCFPFILIWNLPTLSLVLYLTKMCIRNTEKPAAADVEVSTIMCRSLTLIYEVNLYMFLLECLELTVKG